MLAIVNGAVVVLAIGILIFVHELGHFLVAKKVGIRVEAFSLGFGPMVWGFKRGDTVYKLCLIPLGGYVKMTGEAPEDRPDQVRGDEFFSKTVSQRAWVVSAGVIMNVIFAIIAFPLAFAIGVPLETPVVGAVTPGSPAWEAGIEAGDEIVTIDGNEVLSFGDVRTAVAVSDEALDFDIRRGDATFTRRVAPVYSDAFGIHVIGIGHEQRLPRFTLDDDAEIFAKVKSLRPGDEIVTIEGQPANTRLLLAWLNYAVKDTISVGVRGGDEEAVRSLELPLTLGEAPDDGPTRIGISAVNFVIETIAESEEQSDLARRLGLQEKDRLLTLNSRLLTSELDIEMALAEQGASELTLTVLRNGEAKRLGPVPWDGRRGSFEGSFVRGSAGCVVAVSNGTPAFQAGLRSGDRIVAWGDRSFDENSDFSKLRKAIQKSGKKRRKIAVVRGEERLEFELAPAPVRPLIVAEGLEYPPSTHEVHRPFPASVVDGFHQTGLKLTDILMTLRGLLTGGVAAENLGGIITIARVSYTFAEQGMGKILFFMAILSLNLAILNILPIPVLDGGHLVFLILEKIKGGPIDERWMGYANVVGLVFILGLMLFVTYNDIMRLVTG